VVWSQRIKISLLGQVMVDTERAWKAQQRLWSWNTCAKGIHEKFWLVPGSWPMGNKNQRGNHIRQVYLRNCH